MVQAVHDLIVRGSGVDPELFSSRPTVSVNVLSDRDTLATGPHPRSIAETFDGQPLAPATIGRLCCDATIRRLDTAPDIHIHAARASRTATTEQRAALRALYPTCPLSGAPWSQIEVHHVIEWDDGGKTQLSNLVPISSRWHHLIHEGQWTLHMDPDRTLQLSVQTGHIIEPSNRLFPSTTPTNSPPEALSGPCRTTARPHSRKGRTSGSTSGASTEGSTHRKDTNTANARCFTASEPCTGSTNATHLDN